MALAHITIGWVPGLAGTYSALPRLLAHRVHAAEENVTRVKKISIFIAALVVLILLFMALRQ